MLGAPGAWSVTVPLAGPIASIALQAAAAAGVPDPSALDDRTQLAFEFARDLAIQLIVLSTGVIALTVAFTKDVLRTPDADNVRRLYRAWRAHGVAVFFGVLSLMALTGALAPAWTSTSDPLRIPPAARVLALAQVVAFLYGTALVVRYGTTAIRALTPTAAPGAPQAGVAVSSTAASPPASVPPVAAPASAPAALRPAPGLQRGTAAVAAPLAPPSPATGPPTPSPAPSPAPPVADASTRRGSRRTQPGAGAPVRGPGTKTALPRPPAVAPAAAPPAAAPPAAAASGGNATSEKASR